MLATTSEKHVSLSDPIPTKFFAEDLAIITNATRETGLTRSEIIRRAVRLLGRQKEVVNGYEFLLRLTA
jgi:hypothetical protein